MNALDNARRQILAQAYIEKSLLAATPKATAEEVKKLRHQRWKQEQEEIWLIEITSAVIAVTFISLIFWWLMWRLRNLSGGF
jgi:hypothetical protein